MKKPLITLVACAFVLIMLTSVQAADKPNILVIQADDIGVHNISAYNLGIMGYTIPFNMLNPE